MGRAESHRYVALLRGINVGKAKRIAMADLRNLFVTIGYTQVATLLNSGNVVFSASSETPTSMGTRIEGAVEAELGVSAKALVKTADEVAKAVAENPFGKDDRNASRLLVLFTQKAASLKKLVSIEAKSWAPEEISVGKHAAYMWFPDGIIDSEIAKAVGREMGDLATTRNWATVQKLNALLQNEDD
jgi:uncharacterized protein (DUF1697 family)